MRRASSWNVGAIAATVLLVLTGFAVIGIGMLGVHSTHLGAVGPSIAKSPTTSLQPAFVKPSGPSPPVTAAVVITAQPAASSAVPDPFNFSIVITGAAITADNVTLTVAAWEVTPLTLIANCTVAVVAGQTAYTAPGNYECLTSQDYNGGQLPGGNYRFTVWVSAENSSNETGPATAWASATTSNSLLWVINTRVSWANAFTLYEAVPVNITFNVSITGNQNIALRTDTTVLSVEIRFIRSGCGSQFGLGAPCPSVANNSVTTVNLTNSYSAVVDRGALLSGHYGSARTLADLPQGEYQIIAWATVSNSTNAKAEPRSGAAADNVYLQLTPVSGSILSPSNGSTISTGNTTIAVGYTGDWINGANVTVLSSGGSIVFSNPVFVAGKGMRAVSTLSPWVATTPGTYTIVLSISAIPPLAAVTSKATVTVIPAGGTVYVNQSSYSNQTVLPGLSGPLAGTVLILVGLIVGMGIALALGRAMWGGAKPAPAQPWTGTAGANECPVCHQTFPTEEAMKEHSKSAHGMQ